VTELSAAMLAASVFEPLYSALGSVLAFFYGLVPSFAFAIAMLTVTVRVALIPLTAKQVKSQQAMQRIQPEMKRLQTKHRGDRQKLNEEMMKLYKEHQVNPLSGCLPILLQMPLFIVLYRLILDLSKIPPRHLPTDSALHAALSESGGRMVSFGMDLADKAGSVAGFGNALPYYVLIALVVATGFYQQRQMTARMPAGAVNPQMQIIGKVFPVMMGLISLSIPAGVVVYFVVSNLWQIGQQAVTFRNQPPLPSTGNGKDAKTPATGGGKGAKTPPKGGGKGAAGSGAKGGGATGGGVSRGGGAPKGAKGGTDGAGGADQTRKLSRWLRPAGLPARPESPPVGKKAPAGPAKKTGNTKNAKGKRPPPSPRPKGMPPSRPKGAKGPRATPPKKDR
jgi:YidC/Oxa1 family membrane protein insertase